MPERFYVTRRRFLYGAAALPLFGSAEPPRSWDGPAVVRKLYLGGRPGWPRPDANVDEERAKIDAQLAQLERQYPALVRFTGGDMVRSAAEMDAWLAKPDDSDVTLAFNMVTIVFPMLRKLVESNRPSVLFALPYMGHDWTHAAAYVQKGARFDLIASSSFAGLEPWLPLFRTVGHLRRSKVLLISPPAARPKGEAYTAQFGTAFGYPAYAELKALYDAVDPARARVLADEFIRGAARVVEPTREEITDSMRLYLAIGQLLEREKANAVAIDCLGGFGRKELPAYPCIAFSKLNDGGRYGVCECDLDSAMTQLLVTSFSGMPGFVSDPVFDTSRNEVIHAHCVSATKLQGVNGPASPYWVRSHLEDHKGASMQVLAPAGGTVTVARFAGPNRLMLSTGEALGNVDDERGCRTKIRTRVKDGEALLAGWAAPITGGPAMPGTRDLLHRVVFYGDHVKNIERLGRLTGFKTLHEA
ncbi:MAG: hypothetical protein ACE15B_23435 [Bryobacteraceae bacterium]